MNKKSIKLAAEKFVKSVDETLKFTQSVKDLKVNRQLSSEYESWCFDYAIIRLCHEFENFMFHCLIVLINNDSEALRRGTGIRFSKHMSIDVCEYLIVGDNSYYDMKNREEYIKKLNKFFKSTDSNDHNSFWFLEIVKKPEYQIYWELCTGLRHFSAHNSSHSKKVARDLAYKYSGADKKKEAGKKRSRRMQSSSGAWLKIQEPDQRQTDKNRFTKICESLKRMAEEIRDQAPY